MKRNIFLTNYVYQVLAKNQEWHNCVSQFVQELFLNFITY